MYNLTSWYNFCNLIPSQVNTHVRGIYGGEVVSAYNVHLIIESKELEYCPVLWFNLVMMPFFCHLLC